MLDWVFEGIVSWIGENVNSLLDSVSGMMTDALGVDMTVMASYFPFLNTAFSTVRYIGWILLILLVIWQLFRAFAGPVLEAENPWSVLARGTLSAFCIGYSMDIFNILIGIAKAPYEVIRDIPGATFTFTQTYGYLDTALRKAVGGIAMSNTVLSLLMIIMIIAVGWNYVKLLLEVVERYVMTGILYFLSPLAFSMLGSKSTSNVFRAWCRMTGSELLLLVLNTWFIRGFNSGMTVLLTTGGAVAGNSLAGPVLCIFCLIAYLKAAQKADAYLASLGLNTAQTGGNLGMELLLVTKTVGSALSRSGLGHGGSAGGFSPASGSAAQGTAASSAGFAAKFRAAFSPETYRQNAISAGPDKGIGGLNGWGLNILAARSIKAGHATDPSTVSKIADGTIIPKNGAFAGRSADVSLPGFMTSFKGSSLSNTVISEGKIKTEVTSPDGLKTGVTAFPRIKALQSIPAQRLKRRFTTL